MLNQGVPHSTYGFTAGKAALEINLTEGAVLSTVIQL